MPTFDLTASRLAGDGTELYSIALAAESAARACQSALGGTGGMGGDDEAAEVFAHGEDEPGYDESARSVLEATLNIAGSLRVLDAAIANTARAYDGAQLIGAFRQPSESGIPEETAATTSTAVYVPTALGKGPEGPLGEFGDFLKDALANLGVILPSADAGKLTNAESAWTALSGSLSRAASRADSAFVGASSMTFPQKHYVLSCRRSVGNSLEKLSESAASMATFAGSMRDAVNKAWEEIVWFIAQMAVEIAIEIGLGVFLGAISFGAGAAAMAVKIATTVFRWAMKIAALCRRLRILILSVYRAARVAIRAGVHVVREAVSAGLASTISTASFNVVRGELDPNYQPQNVLTNALAAFAGGGVGGVASRVGGSGVSNIANAGLRRTTHVGSEAISGALDGLTGAAVESGINGTPFQPLSGMVGGALLGAGMSGRAPGHGGSPTAPGGGGGPSGAGSAATDASSIPSVAAGAGNVSTGSGGGSSATTSYDGPTPGAGGSGSSSNGGSGAGVDVRGPEAPTPGAGGSSPSSAAGGSSVDVTSSTPDVPSTLGGDGPGPSTPSTPTIDAPSTPAADAPSAPAADAPSAPAADAPVAPAADAPVAPAADAPVAPAADAPVAPAADAPVAPAADAPVAPAADAPVAPAADAPAADAPVAPAADAPAADAPASEAPSAPADAVPAAVASTGAAPASATSSSADSSTPDAPSTEAPAADSPAADAPAQDAPTEADSSDADADSEAAEAAAAAGTAAAAGGALFARPFVRMPSGSSMFGGASPAPAPAGTAADGSGADPVAPDHASDGSEGPGTTYNGYSIPELSPEVRQDLDALAAQPDSPIVRNPDGSYSLADPITVEPFTMQNPRHDWSEFQRQVGLQQQGLNDLTLAEWLHNRDYYSANNRVGKAEQAAANAALSAAGIDMNGQAVLHGPDQVAGGRADRFDGAGSFGVNSSLGNQWRGRIDDLLLDVRDAQSGVPAHLQAHIHLNVELGAVNVRDGGSVATRVDLAAAQPVTGASAPSGQASASAIPAAATVEAPSTASPDASADGSPADPSATDVADPAPGRTDIDPSGDDGGLPEHLMDTLPRGEQPAHAEAPAAETPLAPEASPLAEVNGNGASAEAVAQVQEQARELFDGLAPQNRGTFDITPVAMDIIPSGSRLTDLAEWSHLAGHQTFDGRDWGDVRGVMSVIDGQVRVAIGEETLGANPGGYGHGFVAAHEGGHAVQAALTPAQLGQLTAMHADRVAASPVQSNGTAAGSGDPAWLAPDWYSAANREEYFANSIAAYHGHPYSADPAVVATYSREWLRRNDPRMFALLEELYGGTA